MKVHICVEWHDGWWRGIAYTFDDATGEENILYTSHAYSDKRDAQEDVLTWRQKWVAQRKV